MQRFLIALTLALSLVIPQEATGVEMQYPYTRYRLIEELYRSIKENILMQLYFSNFETMTNVHAAHCGILHLNPEIVEVSYSYRPVLLCISVWHPESNEFTTSTMGGRDIDQWIAIWKNNYKNGELSGTYTFDEWLELYVMSETWRRYIDFLHVGDMTGDFHGVDIEDSLRSMEALWGVALHPQLDGVFRIVYEYRGTGFNWTLLRDDIEIFSWGCQLSHARGESRETNEVIQGEIVL